ncbi:cobaltochelatase subunit CobN [Methanomassiliicoccus luminyensis]|uniref:cobaltochelatase subunit CobN n=2 Tax=Methanomassiliicoccus luminyensis TaxID=1080712 RepID=UPI000A4A6619|nr:cobaltochelatase subunit CobN [Methanomassiliicoccus luminyensis]
MIVTCLGIGSRDGHVMDAAADALHRDGYEFDLEGADYIILNEDPLRFGSFVKRIESSDLLVIKVHGDVTYLRRFDQVKEAIGRSGCSALLICTEPRVMEEHRHMFKQSEEDYQLLRSLTIIGGDDNLRSVLLWALRTFDNVDVDVPDPVMPLAQGVYRPGMEAMSIEDGVAAMDHSRPAIGIFFHQKFWLVNNLQAIDRLIECVERRGANALPIFLSTYLKDMTGSIGIKNVIDNYLIKDGEPLLDCIIETSGFAQTLLSKPGDGTQISEDNFFERLGVPVIQAMMMFDSGKKWKESPFGLNAYDIAMSVVNPEYDGQIITVPFAGQDQDDSGRFLFLPLEERAERIADIAYLWANLRRKENREKKVAVLLYMYPPRQDLAGGASGLDSIQSVVELLKGMKKEGYSIDWLPSDGKELAGRLLDGVTNDNDWKTDGELIERSADLIGPQQYEQWFNAVSDPAKKGLIEGWGEPPGDIHTVAGMQLIPGFIDGNVFIGFQPDRGKTSGENIHDPDHAMPHQYLGFYRWLRYVFGADAVVHIGTHGSLEWLPGKSVGLSEDCYPDVALDSLPNIYPYIIDNPGEGMQAKRRSYAVVSTHMIPSMTRAGSYEGLGELESIVQAYMNAKSYQEFDKLPSILEQMGARLRDMSMLSDLDLPEDASLKDLETKIDRLYDYIIEVKEALINDGLHILGEVPEGKRLVEMIYGLTRYANGDIPSLRGSIAGSLGFDLDELINDAGGRAGDGRLNGQVVDEIEERTFSVIETMMSEGFAYEQCAERLKEDYPEGNGDLAKVVGFICDRLYGDILRMNRELESIIAGLNGEYVLPGPSGCPTRGRAQILPTGTNFYSIDPDGIPWHSSWDVGRKMADQMIERYAEEKGEYPKSLGIVIWATDVMRTGGDDIAYILWLMGLRPVWTGYGGRIKGLEIVPVSELGRPRVDVTLRISGLFRDAFPNLMDMIDDGVQIISSLDESEEENYLAANLRSDMLEAIRNGIPHDEARRLASIRIFGDAPGQYGCGVNTLINTGNWKDARDLGAAYQRTGCHVYGRGLSGQAQPELFKKRLAGMNVTVKNHSNRECDMFDMDDDYDYLGGFNAAVRSVSGKMPTSFMGDSSDTVNLKLRSTAEECKFIFRSKINNPKWLEGLKQHGFRGAQELSTLFDYVVAWDATSDIIEDWMYEDITENFVLDEETQNWIKEENPYAMVAMLARLQEAIERGMWKATNEMKERLKDLYMKIEERMEEMTDR